MKKQSFSDLKNLELNEIKDRLNKAYQETFDLKFQNVKGQLKDVSQIAKKRLEIARLKTLLVMKSGSKYFQSKYVPAKLSSPKKEIVVKKVEKKSKKKKDKVVVEEKK